MNNKVVITGAGSGLGRALALKYASQGADVCVVDMNADGGEQTVSDIVSQGGNAFFQQCNITEQWEVDKLVVQLAEKWGSVDVLVNNAGVATAGQIEYESIDQWDWVMSINVIGQVRMTKALLPLLRKSNAAQRGLINVASQAGLTSAPGMGSYCASKAAVVSFSETMYLELAPEGMHVSVVCPAFFETNLNQSLRTGDADMQGVVTKLIKNSGVTAESIAEQVYTGFNRSRFLIATHKQGRNAYRLRRFLPIDTYLSMMKKKTERFIKKAND